MHMTRRALLGHGAATALAALWPRSASAASFRVGVGRDPDAYAATRRALDASGEWPSAAVSGRTVVIKPNLVSARPAATGVTTDPEVVRAIVDQALADGAAAVRIVEDSNDGAVFTACGYDVFADYDPDGRVELVNLERTSQVLAPVRGGMAYTAIYVAELLLRDDVVFVSAAKLKTHGDAVASLTMKNLFGLPGYDRYVSYWPYGRFAMHDRSLHQTIVDINRLRPVHFAVLDGMWAMEGPGPLSGWPVRMDTVLAGRNALAVDRVGLSLMQLPQRAVRHLDYAARVGLGPLEVEQVTVAGDTPLTRPFAVPRLPPFVEYPSVWPAAFIPSAGQATTVRIYYAQPCIRTVDILGLHEDHPAVDLVRTLRPYETRGQGWDALAWDGRTNDGTLVPAGRYAAHVRAFQPTADGRPMDGMAWTWVVAA
jgi:uncharacterized protein (DUF362 family)